LYQILELLQQAREDRINIARYAYLLARMEPKENYRKESYREFSAAMYRWILSEEDRRQLITAIHLYVYAERKAK
jgi:CRISPR-associated protein Csm1